MSDHLTTTETTRAATASSAEGAPDQGAVAIEAIPSAALTDSPVTIVVRHLRPRQVITVTAEVSTPGGTRWASAATFVADATGEVDLAIQTPVYGDYAVPDAQGLLWSLSVQPDSPSPLANARFLDTAPADFEVILRVLDASTHSTGGPELASTRIVRWGVHPKVQREDLRTDGLHGTLYLPPGAGPHPALIIVPGSDGGVPESWAALYASHGYAALALGYFNVPEAPQLPRYLVDIPLEYFAQALQWLQRHEWIDADRVGISGASRGGELALLLASRHPELRLVLAWAPGSHVQSGFAGPDETRENPPAWTHGGEPIPFAAFPSVRRTVPAETLEGYLVPAINSIRGFTDRDRYRDAEIAVERINGPIAFIAGEQDTLWPSAIYSRWAIERLEEHDFPHPHVLWSYPEAGHTVGPAGHPATIRHLQENRQGPDGTELPAFHQGGRPAGIAAARADLWPRVLDFLAEHLSSDDSSAVGERAALEPDQSNRQEETSS